MANELHVLFYSLIGGVVSLVGGLLLVRNKKRAQNLAIYATPFAAGVLLATAFTDFLPEALAQELARPVMIAALVGMVSFFFLERFLRWFHHHHEHAGESKRSKNSLIIIGDTLHNALDGVAIGAAFLIDVPTGVVASIAVAAHEIPQEIGDFGLLLRNGMKRGRVVAVNVVSALATTATALATFSLGGGENNSIPFLLAATAGFFIYIATSDIIPEIHDKAVKKADIRPWLLLSGVVFIMVLSPLAHDYIDAGHDHSSSSVDEAHTEDTHHDEAAHDH